MSSILAIDPGPVRSAWIVIDAQTRNPMRYDKWENPGLLHHIRDTRDDLVPDGAVCAIEMVASYGMSVGAQVFETCVVIGRLFQALAVRTQRDPMLVYRHPIKLHHCHDSRAKDSNIRQALVDRFAPGQPNHGKGTKDSPGWFYGFHSDLWQAYALAVYIADTKEAP